MLGFQPPFYKLFGFDPRVQFLFVWKMQWGEMQWTPTMPSNDRTGREKVY